MSGGLLLNRSGARRRGITLLECLIAIFVVAVGLLGILSLLPVAHRDMNETMRADTAAALGRRAWQEIQAGGLLDCSKWINNFQPWTDNQDASAVSGFIDSQGFVTPVLIDPVGC